MGRAWNVLSTEEIGAIVNTAHNKNRKVSVHITHERNLVPAIAAGVNDINHMVVEPLDDTTINEIIQKNIYWIPTLELWHGVKMETIAIENLAKFYEAGGKIALGTDFGGYITKFDSGFPITEVLLMKKAGMTNMDIIISGTKNAAYVCGLDKEIGTLEEGKWADITVVKGDPLENLKVLENPVLVVHRGNIIKNVIQ
jgi:imidazolonepropionase-like amidohydrolase